MGNLSLKEIEALIKQQIQSQEEIDEHLLKAEAMAQVALGESFLEHDKSIRHAYLWALADLISHIKTLHVQV